MRRMCSLSLFFSLHDTIILLVFFGFNRRFVWDLLNCVVVEWWTGRRSSDDSHQHHHHHQHSLDSVSEVEPVITLPPSPPPAITANGWTGHENEDAAEVVVAGSSETIVISDDGARPNDRAEGGTSENISGSRIQKLPAAADHNQCPVSQPSPHALPIKGRRPIRGHMHASPLALSGMSGARRFGTIFFMRY